MDQVPSKEAFIHSLFDDRGLFEAHDGCTESAAGRFEEYVECSGDRVEQAGGCNAGISEGALIGHSQSPLQQDCVNGRTSEPMLECSSEWIPMEGMVVENVVEAFIKYSEYARRAGFEVRFRSSDISSSAKNALQDVGVDIPPRQRTNRGLGRFWDHDGYEFCSKVRLQCVKGEKLRSNRLNPERPVRSQSTNCKAGIYLVKGGDGSWEFRRVRIDHNHDLEPNNTRFMRNYRIVNGVDEMQIVLGDRAGVTPSRGYMNFVVGRGGIENVPFSLKDSHSVIRRWRMQGMENGDFNAMQKIFNEMKSMSDDFFYSYDTDGDGRVKNIFWADARSRAAYYDFGDVLCFDTTHLKNRYKMPLAPFIGVNHHGQSILLGCVLLSKEDVESFKWVFETWLSCMHNKAPKCIMTDQCQAIGNAVACVFPDSRHRWCLWHIMKNGELHLRKKKEWLDIRKDLSEIVHGCCDAEEFEGMWNDFICKYKLEENDWLDKMFDLRERWVPAYFLHEFWAGLQSTQRSEGMNNFFRSYVNINTGLKQFAEQYCLAVGKRVDDEEREDWKSKNKPVKCAASFQSEEIFQRRYTVRKFLEFQNEAKRVAYVNTERVKFDVDVHYHLVTDICGRKGLGRTGTKKFSVRFEVDSNRTTCACKMFEFKGIICRHIVAVWKDECVNETPSMYILDRWRKDRFRRSSIVKIPNHMHAYPKTDDASRCEKLQAAMRVITDLAMTHDSICTVVLEDLEVLNEKCKSMLSAAEEGVRVDSVGRQFRRFRGKSSNVDARVGPVAGNFVLDPVDKRGKGRLPTRRKGGKGGKSKLRKCAKVTTDVAVGGNNRVNEGEVRHDGGHSNANTIFKAGQSSQHTQYHIFFA